MTFQTVDTESQQIIVTEPTVYKYNYSRNMICQKKSFGFNQDFCFFFLNNICLQIDKCFLINRTISGFFHFLQTSTYLLLAIFTQKVNFSPCFQARTLKT